MILRKPPARGSSDADLRAIVRDIYRKYWSPATSKHVVESDVRRYAASLRVLLDTIGASGTVVDIGGGWGVFSCACAVLGFRAIMVDDCGDPGYEKSTDPRHAMPSDYGVLAIERDIIRDGVDFKAGSIDAFTSFDSMEHWHHSPKRAFHQMMVALRPGGLLLLSAPNSNDFGKRITVPLGTAEWSSFDWWYHKPVFRSHVREPSVRDFRLIAQDLSLHNARIFGRNDSLLLSPRAVVRGIARPLDRVLRLRPSLCTEIYLAGCKPAEELGVKTPHYQTAEPVSLHTRPANTVHISAVAGG